MVSLPGFMLALLFHFVMNHRCHPTLLPCCDLASTSNQTCLFLPIIGKRPPHTVSSLRLVLELRLGQRALLWSVSAV